MNIQPSYGVLAYQAPGKIDLQQLGRSVTKFSALDTAKTTSSSNTVDQVTISSAAKALAASENNTAPARTAEQERVIASASSDSETANQIAYGLGNSQSRICYDISKGDVRKLASTGKIVDDNYINNFTKEASVIDAQKLTIYNTEKAKGTDPLEIIKKIIDFKNSQSPSYLEATAWGMV